MQCEGCTLFSAKDGPQYNLLHKQSRTEISDTCLNSRVAWNSGFNYQKAMIEDCMCLVSDGGVFTTPHLSWPVGMLDTDRLQRIVDTLAPAFRKRGWPLRILYIDQANLPLLQNLSGYRIHLKFNPDFSDYLYDAEELRRLSGKDLHAKRNHFNRFCRTFPDYSYSPVSAADRDEALALVSAWCAEKEVDCQDICQSDYRAIRELFDHFSELDIRGGTIRIGGRLVAFALGSVIGGDTAVIHFEKAEADYLGLYAAINKLVLDNAFPDMKFVNREEDMGIPGLRKSKLSYGPIRQIDKYEALLEPVEAPGKGE